MSVWMNWLNRWDIVIYPNGCVQVEYRWHILKFKNDVVEFDEILNKKKINTTQNQHHEQNFPIATRSHTVVYNKRIFKDQRMPKNVTLN